MLEKFRRDIDKELAIFLRDTASQLKLRQASKILYGGIHDFVLRKGKRIRPVLFLISYLGYTQRKKSSYKKLVKVSLSTELLHDFLLIHDDVIDKSSLRRGKPTLHRLFNTTLARSKNDEFGPNLSIIAGDIIFALAIESLLLFDKKSKNKQKALVEFTKIAALTGVGEFIDVLNNIKRIEDISKKDVLLTYMLKTAKYTFEGPLLIGALLADTNKKELKKLSKLGILLGEAFQLHDDLLDLFSSSKKIGKPILSDLNESKKTLVIWKAYNTLSGKNKKLLKNLLNKKKKNHKDLLRVRKLIKFSGADKYCQERVRSLLREANSIVSKLRMKKKYKDALIEFIEIILGAGPLEDRPH